MTSLPQEEIVAVARLWIENVVIRHNFCPFAKPVFDSQGIRYLVADVPDLEESLGTVLAESQWLDQHPEMETTLIIYPNNFEKFDDFLTLIDCAEELIDNFEYRGTYQLAHFHPDYCFAGSTETDPANYTNRSPFPMLHLLREDGIETALRSVKLPESIPKRNIRHANSLGLTKLQQQLSDCFKK